MQRDEAIAAVQHVDELIERTEHRVRNFWQPAALWGALLALRAPYAFLPGTWSVQSWTRTHDIFRWYTFVAITVGIVGTVLLQRRRAIRTGTSKRSTTFVVLGIAVAIASPIGAFVLLTFALNAGDPFVFPLPFIAAFTLTFALATRNRGLAIVSAVLLGLAMTAPFYAGYSAKILAVIFPVAYLGLAAFERRAA
jgi:hypothetical protein